MKSFLIWTGVIVGLCVLIGFGTYYAVEVYFNKEVANDPDTMVDEEAQANLVRTEVKEKKDGKPTVKTETKWTEHNIMRTLHEMTHQKVKAPRKWGAVPMTKENVEKMIGIVKKKKGKLDHYQVYMDMLNMWEKGDFSQTAQQHNKLWSLENGTVGRATGLVSEKAEQAFIEQHFSDVKGTFEW